MDDPLLIPELEAKVQTYQHIDKIRELLRFFANELVARGETHDRSKLMPQESRVFAEYTPKLKGVTYGSDDYNRFLVEMESGLRHHYANNRHHPEFWEQDEEWKPVPGYDGHYEVSSHGRVRSLTRVVDRPGRGDTVTKPGQMISGVRTAKEYVRVQLTLDGVQRNFMVHRLVATAFIPNPHMKPEVNHLDGNKVNNARINLEWATSSENLLHAYDSGLKSVSQTRYVVQCVELDLITFGVEHMARLLRERGYERASGNGIYNAMDREGKHLDLTFESWSIAEWNHNRLQGMNLIDLMEMWIDWYASSMRHADGDMAKSIKINEGRFGMSPDLAAIFRNTFRDFKNGKLSVLKDP